MVAERGTVEEFCHLHDAYISDWGRAMETGDTEQIEHFYSEAYFVTFLGKPGTKPNIEGRVTAVDGMRQSVAALRGAVKRFDGRIVRVRNAQSVVVFYELIIERDGAALAHMFTVEDWRLFAHGWQIEREMVEVV
ncbi:hypothetical protein [Alicyclobacillus sp. ALC3]|uniref:hypothetical protein n=1 Tax=Alicyclobacillus sp. ALC3 TaxID=2796143 RepID=UPI002377DA5F|nr:hypothetical protein [Alicyclobacillus sp. ALC3]WDL96698.1 hypothetical protein JC200_20725 [Alicyclobacillus sp. ALC3]